MVGIKVVAEKGVDYKVWQKNGKHRIYFTMDVDGKQVEIGNYDLKESRFYGDRGYDGQIWGTVERNENPQALIVVGDDKKIYVGPTTKAPTRANRSDPLQRRITLGMCINNATSIVIGRKTKAALDSKKVVSEIYDLADALYIEYQTRYADL